MTTTTTTPTDITLAGFPVVTTPTGNEIVYSAQLASDNTTWAECQLSLTQILAFVEATTGGAVATSGTPSNSAGLDGMFAFDIQNEMIYGPKAGGVWPTGVSFAAGSGTTTANPYVTNYAAVRAYTGALTLLYVTGYNTGATPSPISGYFELDPSDTTTADDGGSVLVTSGGARWKRRITGYILPQWWGAVADAYTATSTTATDNSTAFQAADNLSALNGQTVYLAGGGNAQYLFRTPITVNGIWEGDGFYIDSGTGDRGTLVYYAPTSATETAGFELQNYARMTGISCWTNDVFPASTSLLVSSGWVTVPSGWSNGGTTLLLTSAFKAGNYAFRLNNRATLENCTGRGKYGVVLNSSVGHTIMNNCTWTGIIFGVYAEVDGQDHWINGGETTGLLAGIGCNELGFAFRADRVHCYHSPYWIYQSLTTSITTAQQTGTVFVDARSISLEGITECNIAVCDTTFTNIRYDGYGPVTLNANSPAATEYLPAAIVASASASRWALRLGIVSSICHFTNIEGMVTTPPSTSSGLLAYSARIISIQYPTSPDIHLEVFETIDTNGVDLGIDNPNGLALPAYTTHGAYRTNVAPSGTLLLDNEVGVAGTVYTSSSNASNFSIYGADLQLTGGSLSWWISQGVALTFASPRMAFSQLKSNPWIWRLYNAGASTEQMDLNTNASYTGDGNRPLNFTVFVALNALTDTFTTSAYAGSRIYVGSQATLSNSVPRVKEFQRIVNGGTPNKLIIGSGVANGGFTVLLDAGKTMYFTSPMINYGGDVPYSNTPGPALDGAPTWTNQTTSTTAPSAAGNAGAIPGAPVIWVTETINGVQYKSPKWLAT